MKNKLALAFDGEVYEFVTHDDFLITDTKKRMRLVDGIVEFWIPTEYTPSRTWQETETEKVMHGRIWNLAFTMNLGELDLVSEVVKEHISDGMKELV